MSRGRAKGSSSGRRTRAGDKRRASFYREKDMRLRQGREAQHHYECQGKERYPSKSAAMAGRKAKLEASQTMEEFKRHKRLAAEKCSFYNHWHLTTVTRSQPQGE